jgi:hypothetical protein
VHSFVRSCCFLHLYNLSPRRNLGNASRQMQFLYLPQWQQTRMHHMSPFYLRFSVSDLQPSNCSRGLDASSILSGIAAGQTSGASSLYNRASQLIENGFFSGDLNNLVSQILGGPSSSSNSAAKSVIYPQKSASDPKFDVSEEQLRSAIEIPPSFTYGTKPPVVLVPGTASTGYTAYSGNFLKLLSNVSYADPVWLNVPQFMLSDSQTNAVSLKGVKLNHTFH